MSLIRRFSERIYSRCFSTARRDVGDALASLQGVLPHVEFCSNPYELKRHGMGESHHPSMPPDLIASPRTVEEVQSIVRHCVEHRIPVIPFGAGTSVEGHVSALQGGLSLDMQHLQQIEIPDMLAEGFPDPIAVVGPGVRRHQLNAALRHSGLHFVVDPGADASLGGMVATGASGTTAVRYGTMRENLLGLQCVLADEDATVVRTGTRARKNSAGYDLLSLFCGSEGTLGVMTEITVKLHPVPTHCVATICVFEDVGTAAHAVAALQLSDVPLTRCELLDAVSVQAFNQYQNNHPTMKVKPTLFLELQGSSEAVVEEYVSQAQSLCVDDFGGRDFRQAIDEQERRALWAARHSLYYAAIAFRPNAVGAIVTDACVPLSQFAALMEGTVTLVQELQLVGPCFGHAGDGNLHCILPVVQNETAEYQAKLETVQESLISRTLAMGGTCTGEHGIGYGKMPYLTRQYGPGAVGAMRAVKRGLDPYNIMNPGKVVDLE